MSGLNWTTIPRTDDGDDDTFSQGGDDVFADTVQFQPQDEGIALQFDGSDHATRLGGSIFDANNATQTPFSTNVTAPAPELFGQSNQHSIQSELRDEDSLFGRRATQASYNSADEPVETIAINKTSVSDKHRAAYLAAIGKATQTSPPTSEGTHINSCDGTRGATTPPPSPPAVNDTTPPERATTKPARPVSNTWTGPDEAKDLSPFLKKHKRFHDRAFGLRPPIPLAPHRYWIGILNPGLKPHLATKENHFTWMKGNRFTTVETVWQTFSAMNAEVGFVFMVAGERFEGSLRTKDGEMVAPEEVKVEELDFWGDKCVIFRVVGEREEEAKGRKITEGLVTQEKVVIELD